MLLYITKSTDGVTSANGTTSVESTIWDIKNPETVVRVLQGNHKIRLTLKTSTPTAISTGTVKLVVTDPSGNHKKTIYIGDLALFTGSQISVLETQTINNTWGTFPFYHILVVVNSASVVSYADSTFGLEVEQIDNISFEEAKATFAEFLLG